MEVDYIIVGQGLAGTVLGFALQESGKKVLVISNAVDGASHVAAGMYNPVTGKRMTLTWKAEDLFPYMESFYERMEHAFDVKILHKKNIYKPFASIEEQNTWASHEKGEAFLNINSNNKNYEPYVYNALGGFEVFRSGHVDVPVMLSAYRKSLESKHCYKVQEFNPEELELLNDGVAYQNVKAKKIIFCEGVKAETGKYFSWLPFVPSKGEVLEVTIKDFPRDIIFSKKIFVLPYKTTSFRVGSTYHWDFEDASPTEKGREEIEEKLSALVKVPYEVMGHLAGVRPTIKDRKPVLGLHPESNAVGIFNGLGTKGVSLAPYFANELVQYLENGKQLEKDVHIERFYSLYSHK